MCLGSLSKKQSLTLTRTCPQAHFFTHKNITFLSRKGTFFYLLSRGSKIDTWTGKKKPNFTFSEHLNVPLTLQRHFFFNFFRVYVIWIQQLIFRETDFLELQEFVFTMKLIYFVLHKSDTHELPLRLFTAKVWYETVFLFYCACGWGRVLSRRKSYVFCFFVFMFLCFQKPCLWTK